MRLLDRFRAIFGDALRASARALGALEQDAGAAIHFATKEMTMSLAQDFVDLFTQTKDAISRVASGKSADATTISNLQNQVTTLTQANQDLQSKLDAANQALTDAGTASAAQVQQLQSQLADTQSQLADAKSQLQDVLSQLLALAPAPTN